MGLFRSRWSWWLLDITYSSRSSILSYPRRLCSFPAVSGYQSRTEIFVLKHLEPHITHDHPWYLVLNSWRLSDLDVWFLDLLIPVFSTLWRVLARYLDTRFLFAFVYTLQEISYHCHPATAPRSFSHTLFYVSNPIYSVRALSIVLRKQSHLFRARPVEHFKFWFWYINSYINSYSDSYIKL